MTYTISVLSHNAGMVPCDMREVTAVASVPDAKILVDVNGAKPGSAVELNLGSTIFSINVTSIDASNKQVCLGPRIQISLKYTVTR